MSIATLSKLTLVAQASEKRLVMDQLQSLGLVHLIALTDTLAESGPDFADDLKEALQYLLNAPHKRRLQRPSDDRSLQSIIDEIIGNKIAREDTIDKIDLINTRQHSLAPWGDFALAPLEEMDFHRFWFYLVPLSKRASLQDISIPWCIVNQDHRFIYFVVIAKTEPDGLMVPFQRVHTGSRSLSQLAEDKEKALVQLEHLNAEREALTSWILPLIESRDDSINQRELLAAEHLTLNADELFVAQGWIPESSISHLQHWIKEVPAAYELAPPAKEESPPTLLENNNLVGGGEEAVKFFQLPGYHSWDPSLMIFFSFTLFFSMILADAGYALVLMGVLGLFWRRLSRASQTSLRLRNLAVSLVSGSLLYGVLIGSYFGVEPEPNSLLGWFHVLNMDSFSNMMKLSIGAGALHLIAANGMVAWSSRQSLTALASIGWILVIGSTFLLWLSYTSSPPSGTELATLTELPGSASTVSQIAISQNGINQSTLVQSPAIETSYIFSLIFGVVLILLFSGRYKLTSPTQLGRQLFEGTKALYGLSKAFGDVLSYMRLFALGLSSASLAATFNDLAITAKNSMPSGGIILFILILVLGHTLNFILAIMSGVIHGLRLNLLEFYNWGIQGEGYPFQAFKKQGDSRWNNS